jgi:hypothetical protein
MSQVVYNMCDQLRVARRAVHHRKSTMETMLIPRRRVLIAVGFAVAALFEPSLTAAQSAARKAKAATITLKVDGMG